MKNSLNCPRKSTLATVSRPKKSTSNCLMLHKTNDTRYNYVKKHLIEEFVTLKTNVNLLSSQNIRKQDYWDPRKNVEDAIVNRWQEYSKKPNLENTVLISDKFTNLLENNYRLRVLFDKSAQFRRNSIKIVEISSWKTGARCAAVLTPE